MSSNDNLSVSSWFDNQSILVTGATGFMGKILIEKLLRCCPNISKIYILVRTKREKTPRERLEDYVKSPVFQSIREKYDGINFLLKKLHCISGDLTQDNLNLSKEDFEHLIKNVSLVFHMAANVRFDQNLRSALLTNTGGTLRMLNLAKNFKNLKGFIHVSTAYCHCDQKELEERIYPSPHNPRKILDLAYWMEEDLLEYLTPKLLKKAPNTYAYTKCLTEQLVKEFSENLPIAIARPSIVTAAWKEPIPGWIDNLNGPTGILVGAGKGVIRSMHCNPNYNADIMPVDVCINAIILTAHKVGTSSKSPNPLVINITSSHKNPVSWGNAIEMGRKHVYEYPFSLCLWYPGGSVKSNYLVHWLAALFFHTIPAYFVDFLLLLTGYKPFLVNVQKRIGSGLQVFQYYTTRRWMFHNEKLKELDDNLKEKDKIDFYTNMENLNWNDYILSYILGARTYCVRESMDTLPHARKILKRLYYVDITKNILLALFFSWFTFNFFFA